MPETRMKTVTEPASVYNREGDQVAASGKALDMNSPNTTAEVGYTILVKDEFTELHPGLYSGCQSSTDFPSQPVKSEEDKAVFSEGYNSEGQSRTNLSSSPINFSPRIKFEREREDDYGDHLSQSINDVTTELLPGSSNIGMISESEGNNRDSRDTYLNPCLAFAPLAAESETAFNLSTRIKNEGNGEDDTVVDPLHTSIDIKNEVSLESSDSANDHENEVGKHEGTSAPFNCVETSPANNGTFVIDHTRLRRLRNANEEIRIDPGSEISRNELVEKKFEEFSSGERTRTIIEENGRGRKQFICSQCSARFTRRSSLQEHMLTHTGEKPFSCSQCSARFARKSNLTGHMRTHTGEKPFSCSQCSASLAHRGSLREHMRTHIGEKPFSCSQCSARFDSKSNLTQHMRTHTGEKPFSCSQCSARFSHKCNLTVHIMRLHTGEKPFGCNHCPTSFVSKVQLKQHIFTHTGEKPFSCSQCSARFSHKCNLTVHIMRLHTGEKPFGCNHCPTSFVSKDKLKQHIFTHTGEKPFRCSHCSACFSQNSHLKVHMRTHTGEKPFICSQCSARFARRSTLTEHIRVHTGEKPFSCSQCSARFTKKHILKYHTRTHAGEKLFSCSHCPASFARKFHLKNHSQTHPGEQ